MSDNDLRDKIKGAISERRDCDDAEAEVILERISLRLEGYTHEQVKEMCPLPDGRNG